LISLILLPLSIPVLLKVEKISSIT
jgi:hypothetical protein